MADTAVITHEQAEQDENLRVLKNGAIYDMRTKRIVANPGGGSAAITQADASAKSRLRWKKYQQAAARHVTEELGSYNPNATTPLAAWGILVSRTATAIMDSDTPRGRDLESVGRAMGALPSPYDTQNDSVAVNAGVTDALETVARILELVDSVSNREK